MTWVILRKATEDDINRLDERLTAFARRHPMIAENMPDETPECEPLPIDARIEYALDRIKNKFGAYGENPEYARLNRLYISVVRRALNHPEATGISWGNVGYSIDG